MISTGMYHAAHNLFHADQFSPLSDYVKRFPGIRLSFTLPLWCEHTVKLWIILYSFDSLHKALHQLTGKYVFVQLATLSQVPGNQI